MDSDGTCENSQVSAARCKLVPLGSATSWMLKLNFRQVPSLSMGVHGTLRYLKFNHTFINQSGYGTESRN